MNLIKALWDLMNGKKLNTGTVIILVTFLAQKALGIDDQAALNLATLSVTGISYTIGGIVLLVGYIHRLVKAKK